MAGEATMKMKEIISIIGATGHVGKAITETLLKNNYKVRAIARNREKLEQLKFKGAEIFQADLEKTSEIVNSLNDTGKAFVMIPPYYHLQNYREVQMKIGDNILNAVKENKIKHIVMLSSVGADLESGTGQIGVLYDFENKLKAVPGLSVMALRASYFMENHMASIPMIKKAGINGSIIDPGSKFGMIASQDVAAAAAEYLMNPDFSGFNVQYLLGPKDYSLAEATTVLGKSIGKPDLQYIKFSKEDFLKGLTQSGFSPVSAEALFEGFTALSEGRLTRHVPRSESNTTPTTLEDFAETVFAPAYRMSEVEVSG
jgi:uncharacterized protein YbjT (DUF2867 family)